MLLSNNNLLGRPVKQPDYDGLSSVVFHGRFEGLSTNTDNSYGVVNVSNGVTTWKSVSPHATGINFLSSGTAPTLTASGILFSSAGRLAHNPASTFNAFHYNATLANLKWTIHAVVKFGSSAHPDAAIGLFGNNGGSTVARGVCGFYDDRAAQNVNNKFALQITKGTSNVFINLAENTNIITPNQFIDFWLEVDKSKAQDEQVRLFINGRRVITSNRIDNNTPVTSPAYGMEIGGLGNSTLSGVLTLKEITFQTSVESDEFRTQFILDRMHKYGIAQTPLFVDGIQQTSDWNTINTLSESRYYLTNHLCQNPTNPNTIVSIFADGTSHFFNAGEKLSTRKSTDKGRTWGSKGTVYDPPGGEATRDAGAGYSSDGRLHVLMDTHTSFTPGTSTNKLYYLYSDDDGDTWSAPTDITAGIPADGLATWRVYSSIIENNGVLLCATYKVTDEATFTNSARYCMRSTDNGATWSWVLIQSGAPFRNECDIVALNSTTLLVVTRDDSTLEWYQSISTDNGLTWTNQGALSFGESLTTAAPVRLQKFQIAGTDVIACYITDRDRDLFKVVYAKASDIISSGLSAWSDANKFTIKQGAGGNHLHYGGICHYDGNFKAIGMYVIDTWPAVGGSVNSMYTFDIPTFHYSFIKSALGL